MGAELLGSFGDLTRPAERKPDRVDHIAFGIFIEDDLEAGSGQSIFQLLRDLVPWAWATNGCFSVLGIFSTRITALLFGFSRALVVVEASRAGLILLLQPTLAFIWDVLFFARPTGVVDALGAGLALTAIYIGGTRRR